MSMISRIWSYMRTNGVGIGIEVLVNFVGPFVVFDLTKPALGDAGGLIASSAPPIAWSMIEFARRRRVDALSILVLISIALSLLAFIGGGGVRFLQLREKLVTGLIGLVFLASAAIGRPLIYELARATTMRRSPSQTAELEALRHNAGFRRMMTIITLVWGGGLVVEAALAGVLVLTMSVREFLLVGPVVGYAWAGGLILWSLYFVRRQRQRAATRRSVATTAAAPAAKSGDVG
jgi:hypothetical protein